MADITRSALRGQFQPRILQEEVVRRIQIDHIKQAQDEEKRISSLKIYLVGDEARLSSTEAKVFALIARDYEVDQSGLLFSVLDLPSNRWTVLKWLVWLFHSSYS